MVSQLPPSSSPPPHAQASAGVARVTGLIAELDWMEQAVGAEPVGGDAPSEPTPLWDRVLKEYRSHAEQVKHNVGLDSTPSLQ